MCSAFQARSKEPKPYSARLQDLLWIITPKFMIHGHLFEAKVVLWFINDSLSLHTNCARLETKKGKSQVWVIIAETCILCILKSFLIIRDKWMQTVLIKKCPTSLCLIHFVYLALKANFFTLQCLCLYLLLTVVITSNYA